MLSKQNPSKVVMLSTSDRYKEWNLLQNICYDGGQVTQCNNIAGKNGLKNTPAPIKMSQFDFNIEEDSNISTLIIRYQDRIVNTTGTTDEYYPQFEAPTIKIGAEGFEKTITGEKPNKNFTTHEIQIKNPQITPKQLCSDDFTVTLSYPENTSPNIGVLYVTYFEVEIWYGKPKYNVSFTEPRHTGSKVTWSTSDDPTHFPLYSTQKVTSYFRSLNGVAIKPQEIIYYIPKCFRVSRIECLHGDYKWIDDTHVKWTVTPSSKTVGEGKYEAYSITFYFMCIAITSTEMITADHYQSTATYYADIYNQMDFKKRDDDVYIYHRNFERLDEDHQHFYYQVDVDSIPEDELELMDYIVNIDTRVWSVDEGKYVPQRAILTVVPNSNFEVVENTFQGNTSSTYIDVSAVAGRNNTHFEFLLSGYWTDNYGMRFVYPSGDYEFHVTLWYGEGYSENVLFKYPFYVSPAPIYTFDVAPAELVATTPNIATQTGSGGCTFICQTQEGFGRWKSNMNGFKSFMENRYKHIGALKVPNSHYNPKFTMKNPVKEASWKERKYLTKTGEWEDDLSLSIYLPKYHWKTLEGFVKMDKPVSIELCPTCSDDDVLNHRGWVELEGISNVERVNSWYYKGDIDVKYLTRKYWAKASILKGNRICNTSIPYTLVKVLDKEDYFLNYFEMYGAGQITYDLDKNIVNEINCNTGESLHFRNKWVLKDIDDYRFHWSSSLPSEATDESNDYKYNSITYSIINASDKTVLLQYTLYDFTTFDDDGKIVNTCNVNCTLFKQEESFNLFNKRIKLDWREETPTTYGSTTRFEFNSNYLTITETGANGSEIYEPSIQLDSAEYLIDVSFDNNDVGLLEPVFTSTLNIEAYENILSNSYSNFYEDMIISPFPLTGKRLLFYRKSEEGIFYYYAGDSKAEYIINGFEQYKGGVDLQTVNGVSIMYVDNYTGTLYLNNNLLKVGFDRLFGTVTFFVYDYSTNTFVKTNMVKIESFDDFDIVALNDDKAQIQFGDTLWTMWRGHPYIQCEHINSDLKIVNDYNTANCEFLSTSSGDVIYNGGHGKSEVYLNNGLTSTTLELFGDEAPSFISGEPITAVARVFDEYGESIGLKDGVSLGKMEFLVNGESVYVDPKPTLNDNGFYEWTYTFTPKQGNYDYNMVAHFIPSSDHYESESTPFYYDTHRIETSMNITVNGSSDDCVSVGLNESVVVGVDVLNPQGESVDGVRVTVIDSRTKERVAQGITSNGVDLTVPVKYISGQRIYEYYVIGDETSTYGECEAYAPLIRVYDGSKSSVGDGDVSFNRDGKSIVFHSDLPKPVDVSVDIDDFVLDDGYTYPLKKAGDYLVIFKYDGDDSHQSYYKRSIISISQTPVEIYIEYRDKLPDVVNYGSVVNINGGVVNQSMDIRVTLYDNGSPIASTQCNDTFSFGYVAGEMGNHALQVKYNGDGFREPAETNTLQLVVGYNSTYLRRCNEDVYIYTKDMFQLLDSFDNPLADKIVKYTINGTTYTRKTKSDGTGLMDINLREGVYPVLLEFEGDDQNSSCQLSYNLTVKEPMKTIAVPSKITSVNGKKSPYQKWTNLHFDDLTGDDYVKCGDGLTNTDVITGKDGTYNTPDDLKLSNYGLNIPKEAKITKITARWYERQFNPRNEGNFPRIGEGSVVLENLDKDLGRLRGSEIPLQSTRGFNSVSVSWNTAGAWTSEGITPAKLNSTSFSAILKHDSNTSSNVGSLWLKYFTIEVSYVVEAERDILN